MAQLIIDIGTGPNTNDGDDARTAFDKCNQNFDQLFSGAASTVIEILYNQTSHPFEDFDPVQMGPVGWALADAGPVSDSDCLGLVRKVDDDNFYVQFFGFRSGFVGLTQGATYWLKQNTVSGDGQDNLVEVPPTPNPGVVQKPIMKALSSTEAFIFLMPGWNGAAVIT